jgi:hypothetical protein
VSNYFTKSKGTVPQQQSSILIMTKELDYINDRLDALETCLLTMTELRGYLKKAQNNCFSHFHFHFPHFKHCRYANEIKYIDSFLDYLFVQEKYYRTLKASK